MERIRIELDVVNPDDIWEQAASHSVSAKRLRGTKPAGWPVFRFTGPRGRLLRFLRDVYSFDGSGSADEAEDVLTQWGEVILAHDHHRTGTFVSLSRRDYAGA